MQTIVYSSFRPIEFDMTFFVYSTSSSIRNSCLIVQVAGCTNILECVGNHSHYAVYMCMTHHAQIGIYVLENVLESMGGDSHSSRMLIYCVI